MVDPFSLIPLHVETSYDNMEDHSLHTCIKIADATAFIFYRNRKNYLITNWHVLSGRSARTGRPLSRHAGIPNLIKIWFHSPAHPNVKTWVSINLPLVDWVSDKKLWIEHPRGREIDVAALPLGDPIIYKSYPLDPALFNSQSSIQPSEAVSIIGYPFGLTGSGAYPIWKTGHIASDIDEDYGEKPVFLIDSAVTPGMSGSPVLARKKEFLSEDRRILITLEASDKFLGIFSGEISNEYKTGIGMVWKPIVINEILDQLN